MLVKSV